VLEGLWELWCNPIEAVDLIEVLERGAAAGCNGANAVQIPTGFLPLTVRNIGYEKQRRKPLE